MADITLAPGPQPLHTADAQGFRKQAPRDVAHTAADAALRDAAQAFEAAFLTEMLKHAGLGEAPEAFGGGIGEEQFAGFLREAQAQELASSGGLGLAEYIFDALREQADAS